MPAAGENFLWFLLVEWPRNDLVIKVNILGTLSRNFKSRI